ncbi:hypothetical protein XK97_14690 [Obesumbacterium proteus]|uniref:DUF1883 domain-containing protein n=1 Tax=Obesumbacterium proteus TaxID=82983 RepID=UPI000620FBC4|nr:hypothetical protein XK97_14690 [Obesumbacterium proteus]
MPHRKLFLKQHAHLSVTCSEPVMVLLMDNKNFHSYNDGDGASYFGGYFCNFPANIDIPAEGIWNVVIEPAHYQTGSQLTYSLNVQ